MRGGLVCSRRSCRHARARQQESVHVKDEVRAHAHSTGKNVCATPGGKLLLLLLPCRCHGNQTARLVWQESDLKFVQTRLAKLKPISRFGAPPGTQVSGSASSTLWTAAILDNLDYSSVSEWGQQLVQSVT